MSAEELIENLGLSRNFHLASDLSPRCENNSMIVLKVFGPIPIIDTSTERCTAVKVDLYHYWQYRFELVCWDYSMRVTGASG